MKNRLHWLLGSAMVVVCFLSYVPGSLAFTLTRSDSPYVRDYSMDPSAGNVGTHFDPNTGAIGAWAEIWEPYPWKGESSRREGEATVRSSANLWVTEREWVYFGMIHHGNVEVYGPDKSAGSYFEVIISCQSSLSFDLEYKLGFVNSAVQSTRVSIASFLESREWGQSEDYLNLSWDDPMLYGLMAYENTPFQYADHWENKSVPFNGGRFYSERWYALLLDPGTYSIDYGIHTAAVTESGVYDTTGFRPQGFAFATSKLVSFGAPDNFIPRDDDFHTGAYFLFSESPGGEVDGVFDLTMREYGAVPPPPPCINPDIDGCPDDPAKTEPGICGCGTPDTDSDGDGTPDCNDNCPNEDATDFDSNEDGCIDSIEGLSSMIETLLAEGAITEQMENSLLSKLENAQSSADKENICAVTNQLEALINQVNAQRGKKISDGAADDIIAYADSIITWLINQLPEGESC